MFRDETLVVYLSYFDDSGSDPSSPLCVFGGVVVEGTQVPMLETAAQMAIFNLGVSYDSFQEFKAHELYYATGPFKGIDQQRCRSAFKCLMDSLFLRKAAFVYCAVNTAELEREPLFSSASPVDVAFNMCLKRLETWARAQHPPNFTVDPSSAVVVCLDDLCLVIADDCDKHLRTQLQKTFRSKRRCKPAKADGLLHIHDSMYFGDSVDSSGLQMADLANWTMRRILTGEAIEPAISAQLLKVAVCADVEPEWSSHRYLFRSHLDASSSSQASETAASEPTTRAEDQQ